MRISRGVRLGPYEIVTLLGAGGMGEVWRARDSRLDRDVAVKVLPAEFAANPQLRIRFEREAKAISKLSHPNICALYDVGECEDVNYLVMELLEGETLAARIGRGPLPIPEVLRIGGEIALALEKAHRNHLIHRDLKPANVMITKSGAKLLDFGLAKAMEIAHGDLPDVTAPRITSAGFVVGTPQYMSPEQNSGGEVDHRGDIFALGAVLYEMTTGCPAFDGDSQRELASAILTGTPQPIASLQPAVSPALDHVIMKCLEKDPDDRWQSAHDVAAELQWIASGAAAPAVTPPPVAAVRRRWWLAALLVVAAAVATGVLYSRRLQRPPSYSFTIPSATSRYEEARLAVVSPDGQTVVFSAIDTGTRTRMVWRRRLDSFDVEPVAGSEGARDPGDISWSADGKWILFVAGDKLLRAPAAGGPPQAIASPVRSWGASMNRDGVTLYAPGQRGIARVDPNGTVTEVTKLDKAKFEGTHTFPTFLPDGKHFLFIAIERDPKIAVHYPRLYAGTLGSAETRFLGNVGSRVQYVKSGHLLTVRDGALVALPFDAERLEITGQAIPLLDSVTYLLTYGLANFSASDTGVLTSLTVGHQQLAWMGKDGTIGATIDTLPVFTSMHLAGDRTMLVYSRVDTRYGTDDVWLRDLRDGSERQLTFDSTMEIYPVLSPDHTRVYYMSDHSGWPDIYGKRLDSGQEQLVVEAPGAQQPRDCSPDGRWLLYTTTEDPKTGVDLYLKRLDIPAAPVPFVKTPAYDGFGGARFSPDGRWVAYTTLLSGRPQVYVKPFPPAGPAHQVSLDPATSASEPRWSADGKTLFFLRGGALWRCDFDSATGHAGEARRLFEIRNGANNTYEPVPDGRFIVLMQGDPAAASVTRVVVNYDRLLER